MPEITTLSAEPRARAGKGAARAARRAGRVPGIIYGDNKEPVLISLEPREFSRALAKPRLLRHPGRRQGGRGRPPHLAARRAIPSGNRRAAACRLYAGRQSCTGHGDRAGRLHQPGNVARHPPRRDSQYCPPWDRAELPGGSHPRSSGRRAERARNRRQPSHQPGHHTGGLPADDHRPRLYDRQHRCVLGGARRSGGGRDSRPGRPSSPRRASSLAAACAASAIDR